MPDVTRYIDTHCHLHDSEFYPDNREEMYEKSRQAGVVMLCVGTDIRSSRLAVEFARSHEGCYAIIGVHPHEAKDNNTAEIRALLEDELSRASESEPSVIVGIGEIGLDYFYEHSPPASQRRMLREQLQLAVEFQLPVSFHIRDALPLDEGASVWDDFWPIFDEFIGVRGVMHSFTDTQQNLERGFNRGLFVGINGISTFTKDEKQQKLYREAPLERILLETDAPFLTPKPFRGTMNIPAYVELVAAHQAALKGITPEEVARQTTANAKELFGI